MPGEQHLRAATALQLTGSRKLPFSPKPPLRDPQRRDGRAAASPRQHFSRQPDPPPPRSAARGRSPQPLTCPAASRGPGASSEPPRRTAACMAGLGRDRPAQQCPAPAAALWRGREPPLIALCGGGSGAGGSTARPSWGRGS